MYIARHFNTKRLIRSTWKASLRVVPTGLIVCCLWHFTEHRWLQAPALLLTVMGTAVSFYLGFKGNSAYGRLWEARKIWGGIVNSSRTWAIHVTGMVGADAPGEQAAAAHRELVYRHIGWLAALRLQLRRPKPWEHRDSERWDELRKKWDTLDCGKEHVAEALAPLIDADELAAIMPRANTATQLLHRQGQQLKRLRQADQIDDFRHMELARLLEEFFTLQGKAERIKNFPLPRQYATAAHLFVLTFLQLLPLGLAPICAAMGPGMLWMTIPASMLLAWVFTLWDGVVDYSENPFEGLINDIPMTALSRTIEIDMRQILGETETPPPVQPIDDVLM